MPELPPRRLIVSLYGLYARPEGGWLSVAALVRLMEDLGVDAAAVRSSVSRMKKRGVLVPERHQDSAGYALSPSTVEVLREGDQRIWSSRRVGATDEWLVVVFSVPESQREKRHTLRTTLQQLGFGSAAPGVWVAPGAAYDETTGVLDRLGLTSYTEFFRGAYLGDDVARRIGEWWDLDEISELYEEFVDAFGPLQAVGTTNAEAFAGYVPMLTAWRRLPYLDPGLPLEHLPAEWSGVAAKALFEDLDGRLRAPAAEHAQSLLHAVAVANRG